jgi:outer membrane protein assembly factor BamE
MKRALILSFLGLFLCGCATDMNNQFQRIKVGMEKDEVLGLMDSPQRTQRTRGQDRWTYIFYHEDQRQEKEVHFSEGKAAYVGDHPIPAMAAEERDARNEAANKEIESIWQVQRQEARKAYSDYEQHMKGQDGVRYVPQFTPVQ